MVHYILYPFNRITFTPRVFHFMTFHKWNTLGDLIGVFQVPMAGIVGFEPTTFGFGDQRSTAELYSYNRKRMMKIIRHLEPFLHVADRHGANSRTRTYNLSVNSRLLYH